MVGYGVLIHGRYGGGHHKSDDNNDNRIEAVFLLLCERPKCQFQGGGENGGCPFGVFQVPVKCEYY